MTSQITTGLLRALFITRGFSPGKFEMDTQ
jgi:hypothetical protein